MKSPGKFGYIDFFYQVDLLDTLIKFSVLTFSRFFGAHSFWCPLDTDVNLLIIVTELCHLRTQTHTSFFTSSSSLNFWPAICVFICNNKWKWEYARHDRVATFTAVIFLPLLLVFYF